MLSTSAVVAHKIHDCFQSSARRYRVRDCDPLAAGELSRALRLAPALWLQLQDQAREERYVEADLDVGGQHLSRVGLRFKGSLGSFFSCFASDGTRLCAKLSMNL